MALVIGGVLLAIVAVPSDKVEPGHRLRGAMLALLAAAFHSIGLVLNKQAFAALAAEHGRVGLPAAMTSGFARMGASAAGLVVFGLVTGSLARQSRPIREKDGWKMTFFATFIGTFLAMITMQLAVGVLRSGIVSVLLSMTPIFTIPVEYWLLGRRPSMRAIVGAIIALVGAYLLARGE
jgi:drug/metabolite transporter (DMT)-like permease